jgi:hypothetical protein
MIGPDGQPIQNGSMPAAGNSPLNAISKKSSLSSASSSPTLAGMMGKGV